MTNGSSVTSQTVLRVSANHISGGVILSAEAWRVLTQVDGTRSIAEIAVNLHTDPTQIARTAADMLHNGLLSVDNGSSMQARASANGMFFGNLEKEFVKAMGPLGPILIDEEIANLGESRADFPRDKVAALVERVSAQIADEKERVNFQQIMLDAMRNL